MGVENKVDGVKRSRVLVGRCRRYVPMPSSEASSRVTVGLDWKGRVMGWPGGLFMGGNRKEG